MAVLSAIKAKVWLLHLHSFRRSLSLNVIREVCFYFEDQYFFVAIAWSTMKLYDLRELQTVANFFLILCPL